MGPFRLAKRSQLEREIDGEKSLQTKAHCGRGVQKLHGISQIGKQFTNDDIHVEKLKTLVVVDVEEVYYAIVSSHVELDYQI